MNEEKTLLKQRRKAPAAVILAAAIAAVWLIAELVVFAVYMPSSPELDGDDFCLTEKDEGGFLIERDKTIRFSADCGAVQSISFYVRGERDGIVKMTVSGYDPSNSSGLLTYKSENIAVGAESVRNTVYVDIPENAGEIQIKLEYGNAPYRVDGIVFNRRADTKFNFARLFIVWAIIGVACLVKHFKLWQVYFNPKKLTHGASALALCTVCLLTAVILAGVLCPYTEAETQYPFVYTANYYNPYEQQFDAFMKGQLHIDYPVSEELNALENPYDPAERDGIYYLWDRALYDGKYYSYFGIAPVIVVYFPYYFINKALPAYDTVSTVFAVMTALFLSMAAVKWAAMFTKKLPIPLLWLGTVGAVFSSQIFLVMRGHTRFYYIATIAGMAFLSMFIWLFLCGISGSFVLSPRKVRRWPRFLAYALAGAAFGLLFLSRLNMALAAAFVILPMICFCILTDKKEGKRSFRRAKRIIPELACLALPVIAAVAAQLALNYIRFDSISEFGTTYQLTVSDISQNKVRLTDLPYAIYHYFLQPLTFSGDFPFVSLSYTRLSGYGHYAYIDTGMGLFSIPFMWSALAALWIFKDRKQGIGKKLTLGFAFLGMLAVALMNFCLGGVIYRYTCDITLIAAFASTAILFTVSDSICREDGDGSVAVGTHTLMTVLVGASVLLCLSLAFSLNGNLTSYPADIYVAFRNLFLR